MSPVTHLHQTFFFWVKSINIMGKLKSIQPSASKTYTHNEHAHKEWKEAEQKAKWQAKGPKPTQETQAHPKNTKGLPSQCANN